jgi:hypothetical protein
VEAAGLDLGVELVAVELGGGPVRVEPEVELQVEIAVVVGAELGEGLGEVDVIPNGRVVGGDEAEEGEPPVREEPLLGAVARQRPGALAGVDFDLAGPVEAEAVVEDRPRAVGVRAVPVPDGEPAAVDLVLPTGAAAASLSGRRFGSSCRGPPERVLGWDAGATRELRGS